MTSQEELQRWIAVYNALWGKDFAPDCAEWELRLRQAKRMIATLTSVVLTEGRAK